MYEYFKIQGLILKQHTNLFKIQKLFRFFFIELIYQMQKKCMNWKKYFVLMNTKKSKEFWFHNNNIPFLLNQSTRNITELMVCLFNQKKNQPLNERKYYFSENMM